MLRTKTIAISTVLALLSVGLTVAQEPAPPTPPVPAPKPTPEQPFATATIEGILNQAVQNIARRYNLNEEQIKFTDKMMKDRVNKFLKDHESEVWPIVRELLASGLQAPSDPDTLKKIGAAARPLAKLASNEIFKANGEWAEILSDEQKEVHRFDMKQMVDQFEDLDRSLQDWSEGRPTEHGIFPPQAGPQGPKRPAKPDGGLQTAKSDSKNPPKGEKSTIDVTVFDTIVEEFIKDYELDEGQRDSARSILAEFKGKAVAYKDSKTEDFTKAATDLNAAIVKADRDAIKKAKDEQDALLKPIHNLIEEMQGRLNNLPTTAQKEKQALLASKKGSKTPPRPNDPTKVPPKPATPPADSKPSTPAQPKPAEPKPAEPKPNPAPSTPPASTPPAATPKSEPKSEKP